MYNNEQTLVYLENEKVVAMLARIPYEIKGLGEVTYIYGACTNPNYRNRGIMTELLAYSEELDIKLKKAAIILIPENENLFAFYEKCGFRDYFYKYLRSDYNMNYNLEVNKKLLISNNNEKMFINKGFLDTKFENVTEMKPNFYKIIYNITDLYKTININNMEVIRDTSYYERLIDMYNKNGGKMYVAYDNNDEIYGYTFGYEDDKFNVTELVYKNFEAREFIIRTGSNKLVRSDENVSYDNYHSPYIDKETDEKFSFPIQEDYEKNKEKYQEDYENKYIKTKITIENSVLRDSGIFCIGIESHFAGKMLFDA